ncbi:uncharacterized protein LOC113272828 [Papaver somniferum]|uniref:uncharacterized protein LOC113272828 n=1 Tax=Papaver somniferum TaxID=3469 RepID=UPI000E6FEE77|nr:uncharacterized protein LOC113272828 [Papaver somniferum]
MGGQSDPSHAKPLTYSEKLVGKKTLPTTSYDLSSLPNPTVKEGKPSVIIPEDFYKEGCEIWKFSLIGGLDFNDLNFIDVKKTFESQWHLGDGRVHFIPMVRGFFIIKLKSQEDKDKLFDAEAWIVEHQKLSLLEWYPSFDPQRQKTSHASVWVKFPGLPMEFWLEKTLLSMAKSLGTPIVVDKLGGLNFWQPIDICKKPKFCTHCKIIGHNDGECRKKQNNVSKQQGNARQNIVEKNASGLIISEWKPKKNGTNSTIQHGDSQGSVGDNEQVQSAAHCLNTQVNGTTVGGSNVPNSNTEWQEAEHKKKGKKAPLIDEDYTLADDAQHNGKQQFEFSSENLELLAQLKAQVEQGVELSAEERIVLELGKKMEEDLANLKKIREDLKRTTQAKVNARGVLSPNKFSVLQSKENTEIQTHLYFGREEFETNKDSFCSDSKSGLHTQTKFLEVIYFTLLVFGGRGPCVLCL